ncbi:uncharacterized protein LOC127608541 [Hippocampus zosterae]|uniref:uncharacterized protein LOC127608541 n=1 Tax=Hippocampus zosterae TaxID=109293 RepID=UPI00223CBA53|nr:uncharacterized protein LOC127608541 [Hippocampus zosterae]
MNDYLTEELCKELGQLDPDWFQVLTTQASSKEGNLSDSDDQEELCPNQEANFKTPLRKTAAVDVAQSQHSSIPRVFRRSYVPSPDNDYQQENELLPWDTRSPCLFGLTKDAVPHSNYGYARPRTPNWFDGLHTPQVSPRKMATMGFEMMQANYAQRISESLGADIHPDISWTSSLNTPPALPSTLIISKTNESPSPTTFCMGKSAVLVRKLFPSLSNDSRQGLASTQSNDPLEVLQDSDCPEACPHPTLQKSPRPSPQHNDGTRSQPPPEAIRSPAPSVPDGTENSLPVFLTNSSSVLRQVKTERTEEKGHSSSPLDVSMESELAFSEQRESDQALCRNPPVETEDSEMTLWTPLPLSEIPATTVATQVEDKCATRAKSPVSASFKCAGFTQKKTAFIYTIDKEKLSLKNNSVQGHKLPVVQMSKANDEAGVCNVGDGKDQLQQREAVAKGKPSLRRVNTKDLEMSQLCRAFAQDLSQMSYPGAPPQVGPPPPPPPSPPPCGFSPFACLTALRVARRKAKRQVGLHGDEVPLAESVDEPAPSDSGFLSADADVSHATAARSEKRELHHRRTFESTPTKQHEMCLEEVLLGTWIDTKDTRGSFKDSTQPLVSLQSNGCERKQEIVNVSLPSIQVSEFKTTSNQSMQISAGDPQKDERLFDVCDAQRPPMKSVPAKETPTTSDSALSCPGSLSEKFMWENSDEREETLQGFDGSFQQAQNVPKSPANVNTVTCQADGVTGCDGDPKEEIPAGSYSPPSCPPKASQNNLPFDSSDINESLQGFSSLVKPVQDASNCPGNANAVAGQADRAFECARDATEEIPAAAAPASWARNCDRSNCRLTASQKADVKALCALLEEAGSQFDFTQFRTVKLKQPGKEASALSWKADKDLEAHLLSGIDFDDSFCAEANEKTTLTSCGTTHLEESAVARQPLCAHTTEKEAEESVVTVSQKCLKKTKHLFQDSEASVENDGSALPVRTSRNEQQFVDGYDTEEPLGGFFSSAIPDQSAPKSPGNMLACARQEDFRNQESGIGQVDPLPGGSQFAGAKRVSSAAPKKTESSLGVCHEVEEHPACERAFGKSEPPLTASAKPRSFSASDPFDKLGSASKSLPVSGGKTNDGQRGNAANVHTMDGQLHPVENEKPEHQNGENAASSWLELEFSTWSGDGENTSASAVALAKTKPLLQEDRGDDPSADVKNGASSFHQPGGFRTAKGKPVAVSSAALKKAQLLLDDRSEVKQHPVCSPTATKSELLSASEKPGSFSDNSLFADDSLFDNLDRGPESPSVSGAKDAKTANATIGDKIDCPNDQFENGQRDNNGANPSSSSLLSAGGFSTASGKKVLVSAAALKKAKDLLREDAGDAPSSKMQHGSFSGVEGADLAAAGRNVAAALPTIKLLLDENLAVEEHPGSSPPSGKSEFLPASFAAKGDPGSTLESPALTPYGSKRGSSTSKETLAGCLPHKVTLRADAHFKGMMDSHDRTSAKENPSIVCAKALNVKTDAPNVWLHRHGEKPGNPSLDVASSSSLLSAGGFSTASGKKVLVSAAALKKAKDLLREDAGDAPSSKMQHGSFLGVQRADLAAAGRNVAGASSAALPTIKLLLDENLAVEEQQTSGKSDFLPASFAARGDPGSTLESPALTPYGSKRGNSTSKETLAGCLPHKVTLQADAHFKGMMDSHDRTSVKENPSIVCAKALNVKTDAPNIWIHRDGEKPANPSLDVASSSSSLSGAGFSAASGSALPVSAAKAKDFFQEDHEADPGAKMKPGGSSGVDCRAGGFQTAGGKRVTVSSAALQRGKFLLDDCDSVEDHPNDDPLERKSEFLTPSEKPASFSARSLFGDLGLTSDTRATGDGTSDVRVSKNTPETRLGNKNAAPFGDDENTRHYKNLAKPAVSSSAICSSSPSGGGFSTAGGRSLSVSDEAMTRAKSLFNDFEGENQKLHRNASLPQAKRDGPQHAGLRTAEGGRSSIGSAALKKSKSFFAESPESTSDAARASPAGHWGFSTASGKKVLVSDCAAARAKSLLDESVVDKDAGFRLSKMANNPPSEQCGVGPSQISHCGFSAASGKPASFSTEALQKAKALFDDIGLSDGVQAGARGKTFSVPLVSGLTPGPSACEREKKPAAADEMAHAEVVGGRGQEASAALGGGTIPMPEEAAIVNLESLDLSDCTETQQLFLAQEALDCTKALLQDESLAGPSMTLESASCPPAREQAREKRFAEGTELAGQPPSKRRLLEEFDRSLDSPRGSTLCPQTSSPKGLLKDRPVFKYDVSLGPNITRPRRDGTASVAAAASSKSNQQPSPAGLTLPFFKKTEARPRRSDIATPPAFVPPFKRQRTVVEWDSTKLFSKKSTQNNEDPPTTASDQSMTDPFYGRIPPTDASWGQANAQLARDMQDMRIRKKMRQTVRPLPGSLFRAKTSGATRIPLRDAAAQRPPAKYTQKQLYEYGVHRHVCDITGETAEAFRFRLELFFKKDAFADESGIRLADGGRLIPSEDGTAGKEQFCRALCDTPGVDPKLLADEWVYNHYRWIVWKLASMERSFPQTMGGRCLTPERVLLQLKYRYDVEVDHSRRPALRKIMEKDDTPAKTLVLCICGVVSQDRVANPCAVVWLTDGWYSVKAQLDEPLSALLRKGRLAAGGKLIIHGAQLVGSQEACSPLEAPQSLMLKIFANSSRPARWDTKLGFYKDPRPYLLPLSSLFSNGGPVGCVDIVVLRSYPVQWMERKSDGGVVFRLARAEEEEAARHNGRKQKAMEVLYDKIQAEFEQEDIDSKRRLRRRSVSHRDIGSLQDGQELYEAVGDDLAGLEALLSEQQLETLRAYGRSLMDKKRAEMQDRYRRATENNTDGGQTSCPQRDVTPVWRLCVADSLNPTGDVYQLNLWRPSSDVQALLKESRRYKVYNLATSDRKKRGAVGALQLSATKKTQFQELQASPEWLSACFRPRVSTDFVALQKLEFDPPCGEVDLTGCVVSVLDGKGPSPAFYLADGKVNFVKVLCFSSLLQAGLADVVKPGALLALSNLQLRGRSTRPTPVVYAGDLTVFSTKPKEEHLQKALGRLRDLLQEQETFFVCAEDKLSQLLKRDVCSPALPPKTPPTQHALTNTTSQQPVRSLGSFTPPSRNLQAAADTSSSEKDPRSLKRRRAVDYLSRVPSPPPLFLPLGLAASPFVKKTFNPPRRASTLKTVHTPNLAPVSASPPDEKEEEAWVNDHELAMIDTQALRSNEAL